jgi:carboxylesterase
VSSFIQEKTKKRSFAGGPHGVVLFHGLSSSPLELQFLARGLQRTGYSVEVPVIEGYTHPHSKALKTSAKNWVDAAWHEVEAMATRCESVAVGGLCIGALLALNMAALRPTLTYAVMGLSTTLHYDGWANPWSTPLLHLARFVPFARRITVAEKTPFGLKNERMRAWIAGQMAQQKSSDAGAAALCVDDLLKARDLIKLTIPRLSQIICPTLLIHAKEDDNASPQSAFDVMHAVRSNTIRCILLQNSYHMVSMDQEKDRVLLEMQKFLTDLHTEPKLS